MPKTRELRFFIDLNRITWRVSTTFILNSGATTDHFQRNPFMHIYIFFESSRDEDSDNTYDIFHINFSYLFQLS